MRARGCKRPATGARSTRVAAASNAGFRLPLTPDVWTLGGNRIAPGVPVSASAAPSQMARPRLWPRLVSITAWQSMPASKPGPSATTNGALSSVVPVLVFARTASTTADGANSSIASASGSTRTGISPASSTSGTSVTRALRAVIPSTSCSSSKTAWAKATARRTVMGRGSSVITTGMPQRCSRQATPVARSPAPFISASRSSKGDSFFISQ